MLKKITLLCFALLCLIGQINNKVKYEVSIKKIIDTAYHVVGNFVLNSNMW